MWVVRGLRGLDGEGEGERKGVVIPIFGGLSGLRADEGCENFAGGHFATV